MINKKILLVLSLTFMLVLNFLATMLPLNGLSTASISDSFKVYFVPAGYVFSIWGLIYLTQIWFIFSVWRSKDTNYINKVFPYYVISSLANGLWLVSWHYLQFGISVILMLTLLYSLIQIYLINSKEKSVVEYKKVPFSIYLGWISVATIANITSYLYSINWDGLGIAPQLWAMKMILIAGILSLIMIKKYKDFVFSTVIVWALIGILVKFPEVLEINIGVVVSVLLILVTSFLVLRKK